MTVRLTRRRVRLERRPQDVMAMLIDGKTQAEVARAFKVSREAVSKFVERHSEELGEAIVTLEAQVTDHAIANKVWRIGELMSIYSETRLEANAAESTSDKATMLKTSLTALHSAAEELGQLPKADQNINVKALLLLREISGTDTEVS